MKVVLAAIAFIAIATIGHLLQDDHVRLRAVGHPSDQQVLDHRDSAYTSMTWVVSPSSNYAQMRFFDRVEGGVCLHPTWPELIGMAKDHPTLSHLVPVSRPDPAAPPAGWPAGMPAPDMGTVNNSAYISLFPLGLLLNDRLMRRAGSDPRAAPARILIVGLGSGIGIAHYAHHFPQAAITVVDIDDQVLRIVTERYPLLAWLTTQKTAAGEPRLHLVARDARQFIRYDAARGGHYDLIVLDAYTAGSTIPPHLMTREFFALCATAIGDDGILMANVIGSYGKQVGDTVIGKQHQVLGGAIRSIRAAGLTEAWNVPVLQPTETIGTFSLSTEGSRNNIVLASRRPLDPSGNTAGWERLKQWVPFPELAIGRYVSRLYLLTDRNSYLTSAVPAALVEAAVPGIAARLTAEPSPADAPQYVASSRSADAALIADVRSAVLGFAGDGRLDPDPIGWKDARDATALMLRETDWTRFPRENWRVSVILARDDVHRGERLVGPVDPADGQPPRDERNASWRIPDAPLFTDQRPNADIWNR